ncbi:MAG: ribonuclease P protein component [Deltaproteobacteria bacterium]|nr:ribonuclease P protein component [Deltaproteobacteria bacterium]
MTAENGEGFTRSARIRRRGEFLSLGRRGERRRTEHFTFVVQSSGAAGRLGITVSRKVGGAVTRNLLKRRIRESFRRHPMRDRFFGDLLVIAKAGVGAVPAAIVQSDVGSILEAFGRRHASSR